jgi:hypothetical protein
MMKRLRLTAGLVLAALTGLARLTAADATSPGPPTGVRSSSPALVTLIAQATKQSPTFRRLIETIEASDGIVYVEVGECGHYVRSCLVGVTTAGRFRMLWIEVDTEKPDLDLIASIGHELQHAVEILGDSNVRNSAGMFSFYVRQGRRARGPTAFETTAAIEAGDAVRTEITKARSRTDE